MARPNKRVGWWLADSADAEIRRRVGALAESHDVVQIAVMPDVHLAPDVVNGVAIATRDAIYPHAVGGDIGCGMAAAALDVRLEQPSVAQAQRLFARLRELVPIHKHGQAVELPEALGGESALSDEGLRRLARREGRVQLGTLGRGNHFLELQRDEADGRLWLCVHSGSRAMGQAIRAHHLRAACETSVLPWLDARDERGQAYLSDQRWAARYASASRQHMLHAAARAVSEVLGGSGLDDDTLLDCNHNHVRSLKLDGETVWIHRKGALDASAGLRGIIPGSMGTCTHHVEGRGSEAALCSSSHGAGRVLSRGAARGSISVQRLRRELGDVLFEPHMARRLVDEAPSVYRDINKVMRAQRKLTSIRRTLLTVLTYKGG
ncbi:MAG: RtcB family protein [Myxococcales bacterium]|nr:RtcB family protein [Myxococcales bacterium]